jgi:hypothetical protein
LLHRVREVKKSIRWALAGRFPYRVLYVARADEVFVLAVEHSKQDERGWR